MFIFIKYNGSHNINNMNNKCDRKVVGGKNFRQINFVIVYTARLQ